MGFRKFFNREPHMMKRFLITSIFLAVSFSAYAEPVDLTRSPLFVKKGFSAEWTRALPKDPSWMIFPPSIDGRRSVRIQEIDSVVAERYFLSFHRYQPAAFTFVTSFEIPAHAFNRDRPYGIYLAQIGVNWEIFLNGESIRREIYIGNDGLIRTSKNLRDIIVYIPPRLLKEGTNILTIKIIGDPAYRETGLYLSGDYLVDDYDNLIRKNSEMLPMILIFIYLFIGIYHIFLFLKRTAEKYNLFYGLFSVTLFSYILSRSHTIYKYIPDTTLITRIELASLFLLIPFISAFFDILLRSRIGMMTKVYTVFCGICVIIGTTAPLPAAIDILFVWQISALFVMPYIFVSVVFKEYITQIRTVRSALSQPARFPTLKAAILSLITSVTGNLVAGTIVIVTCGVFDIIDALFFNSGIAVLKYGFLVFIVGITLILAKRFQSIFIKVEELNESLQQKIGELNNVNRALTASESRYRLLVDGSQEIIFTLDEQWRFIDANKAIRSIMDYSSGVKGTPFTDLVHEETESLSRVKRFVIEQLERVTRTREPVQFKMRFNVRDDEPREMVVRFEYLDVEGRSEIIGKISEVIENRLLRYFQGEQQTYRIGNYLLTVEELSYRITENLARFIDNREIMLIRIALREIIINAIEHGNLEITFDDKTRALADGNYFHFIESRRTDPRFHNRVVDIDYHLDNDKVTYIIRDQGKGFDYSKILRENRANDEMLTHGRGISMAQNLFNTINFSNHGTQVTLVKLFNVNEDQSSEQKSS
jgi:PAS domain S-box-containing protein